MRGLACTEADGALVPHDPGGRACGLALAAVGNASGSRLCAGMALEAAGCNNRQRGERRSGTLLGRSRRRRRNC